MTADGSAEQPADDVLIEPRGSLAIVTLNRPRALNALTTAMRAKLAEAFPRFAREAQTYCVVIQSASEKAFSAGGDVREMVRWGREQRGLARRAFKDEYALNWLHECFSKPTISLIDGPVMGSGVGISLFGTHRVAGEKYRFAMPETAIGLFPGRRRRLAAVAHAGQHRHVPRPHRPLDRRRRRLCARPPHALHSGVAFRGDQGGARRHVARRYGARRYAGRPRAGRAGPYASHIAYCFSAPSVEEIVARLGVVGGKAQAWAEAVIADLAARSPTSLKVTHRHIRDARALDLRQILAVDYRLACRFLDGQDFYEGVRAALIDKDGKPKWQPARLEDVTPAMVEDYFVTHGSRRAGAADARRNAGCARLIAGCANGASR